MQGEEDVASNSVEVQGNDVVVSVSEQPAEEQLARLWPSLHRAMDRFYVGQIARDTARLLSVGATVEQIVSDAVYRGIPRAEEGMGHELAVTTDLLYLADGYEGVDLQALVEAPGVGHVDWPGGRDRLIALLLEADQAPITHALTYCNAARWAWAHHPSPATARLALMTAFLAFDSGRGDRRPDSSRALGSNGS